MKKIVAFTIADEKNLPYYEMMKNSLRKFHSEEELPLILIGPKELAENNDPEKFYRMTPFIAKDLLEEYETVIKLDSDQIITGPLNELFEGKFDIGVVNNSNPRELKSYPVSVWNIHPLAYCNAGLVVMKNKKLVDHWWKLCTSEHFQSYQFREQDLLNILIFYGDYKVKHFDEGDSYYGLASKGYWPDIELRGNDLVLPKNEEWNKQDKYIKVIHFAGGDIPNKMNYKIRFKPEVVKKIDELVK